MRSVSTPPRNAAIPPVAITKPNRLRSETETISDKEQIRGAEESEVEADDKG